MFAWKDSYKIGIANIDEQHKALFGLVQNFLDASTHKALVLHAMRLFQYTRKHFSDEEAILRDMNFADLKNHAEHHNQILGKLSDLAKDVANDRFDREKTIEFFDHWLTNHVGQEDQKILHCC